MVLETIDYKKIFYYFEQISSIPRGSGNNKGISDYLVGFAREHGLWFHQDSLFNVIMVKEAAKGYEHCKTLILQGHMDMVCEKDSSTVHDFIKEGIRLKMEGDFIYGEGTTLGGDDGIALAYFLAVLEDNTLIHPRLEILFTTDEEIGMEGAAGLDLSKLRGKHMLNLDSEEEGKFLTGCAGGMTSKCRIPLKYETVSGKKIAISIKGLAGGHSGVEIHKNRTNANPLLGRLMLDLKKEEPAFSVITMSGGLKDNAIPREAFAEIAVGPRDTGIMKERIFHLAEKYKKELKASEPKLSIEAEEKEEGNFETLTKESLQKIIMMLLEAPNGIQKMSSSIEGLVESSLNLGIFHMDSLGASFSYSVRSSLGSYKEHLSDKLKLIAEFLGGEYSVKGEYPAWEYKEESGLRDLCRRVYREQYQKEPDIEMIHAGLECGIIAHKIKDIDIISFGPDVSDIHTPEERMSISSVKRVYDFLVTILEEFCKLS